LREELQKAIRKDTKLDKLKDNVEFTITPEGLRIELLESAKGTFFESGVATPTENGKEILLKLAQELGKLPNKVSLEGHTDSKPFASEETYGNWELSADRANMARRLMQANGLGTNQVTQVRGYADQRLRKPDHPDDPSNRRVSLIVQYMGKPTPDEPEEKAGEKEAEPAKAGKEVAKETASAKPAKE
jgi:chemotaxis protein MotB